MKFTEYLNKPVSESKNTKLESAISEINKIQKTMMPMFGAALEVIQKADMKDFRKAKKALLEFRDFMNEFQGVLISHNQ